MVDIHHVSSFLIVQGLFPVISVELQRCQDSLLLCCAVNAYQISYWIESAFIVWHDPPTFQCGLKTAWGFIKTNLE